jgi:hypothetical protein
MWNWTDGDRPWSEQHLSMRILLATRGSDAETLVALAGLLPRAEVVLAQGSGQGPSLELALRNALPAQEVVTVPIRMPVDSDEPTRPRAILGLRSLRTLIASGATVICAFDRLAPVVIDKAGAMMAVEDRVDRDLALELLARRLDAERMDAAEVTHGLGYARPA